MFCPQCARENFDRNKFCNGCGASLQVEFTQVQTFAPPPPPKNAVQSELTNQPEPVPDFLVKPKTVGQEPEKFIVPQFVEDKQFAEKNVEPDKEVRAVTETAATHDSDESKEDLSKVLEEAELLLDDVFAVEKTAPVQPESFVTPLSLPETPARPESNSADTFKDYFSEVENKFRASESKPRKKEKSRSIFAISLIVSVILLGVFVVFGWHFISRSKPAEVNAEPNIENKTLVVEKTNANQPPPEMVYVPGGEFMMGNDSGSEYERPAHKVFVKHFYFDKTGVTCEEYKKFIDETGHIAPASWRNNNFPNGSARKPVTGVNWDDANAFAKWKGKRLPSEEEWEFAARGTDGRIYPWGNDWKPEMANADNQKAEIAEVGAFKGQSPFGAFDMSGNAWEWTSSDAKAYPNGKPFDAQFADAKVIRGGYFGSSKERATITYRQRWSARSEVNYTNTSFRCVRDFNAKNLAE